MNSLEAQAPEVDETVSEECTSEEPISGIQAQSRSKMLKEIDSVDQQLHRLCEDCDFPSGLGDCVGDVYRAALAFSSEDLQILRQYSIAMIDDEPLQLWFLAPGIIAHAKAGYGLQVKESTTVEDVDQWLSVVQPDLVLFDYYLKGNEKGPYFVRALREQFPDLNFIGFSSSTHSSVDEDFHDAGVIGTVTKFPGRAKESLQGLAAFLESLDS